MKLRTRLIVAFLAMSVLPLTAVTVYTYASSVRAFRHAVESESTETAVEMGRRLELITDEVDRRVEQLWDVRRAENDPTEAAGEAVTGRDRLAERLAPVLGEMATLLERLEIVRETAPSSVPAPPVPPSPEGAPRSPAPQPGPAASPRPPAPPPPPSRVVVDLPKVAEAVERLSASIAADAAATSASGDLERLKSLGETLGPAAVELGVRLAGRAIRLGADELSRHAESRRLAERRRIALAGQPVDIPVHRDGRVVGHVSAQLNLNRTLGAVLGMARRDQGEIPFAVDADGRVYTPEPSEARRIESLRVGAPGTAGVRQSGDWLIVTREDPSGVTFGIARPIGESLREIRAASGRNLVLGLGVIALAVIGIVPLASRMTRNLSALSDGVRQIAQGHFGARVPVRSSDEFGQLARAFNQMAQDVEAHQQLVAEQERLRGELELCRQIQAEMLPHEALRLGLAEVKGVSIPAREVGGDFFNYFELPGGQIALLVGDVSGKGVGAALLMANIQATLMARMPVEPDLARLTAAIDREIERTTPGGVYVTLFLATLDAATKALSYVNAGHHPQFLLRAGGGLERLSSSGLPVGLYAGHGYEARTVQLAEGDLLFFYTDGMVETENERGEMFGSDRLEALLVSHHHEGIEAVLERVEQSVRGFRGGAEPFDDATMMALRLGVALQPAGIGDITPAAGQQV